MFLTGLEPLLEKIAAAFLAPSAWDKRMKMRGQMTAARKRPKSPIPKKVPFGYQSKPQIDPTSSNVFGGAV